VTENEAIEQPSTFYTIPNFIREVPNEYLDQVIIDYSNCHPNEKVFCINLVRGLTGLGFKKVKDYVDNFF
jgi:ribosomal protein L7/L12